MFITPNMYTTKISHNKSKYTYLTFMLELYSFLNGVLLLKNCRKVMIFVLFGLV